MDIHPIRARAERIVHSVPGVFLRRDRGPFLYITNAAGDMGGCACDLERAGFSVCEGEGLLHLSPLPALIGDWLNWATMRFVPDSLFLSLERFAEREMAREDIGLFVSGLKLYEADEVDHLIFSYERKVRECAAVILRMGEGGGALTACAACLALMYARRRRVKEGF